MLAVQKIHAGPGVALREVSAPPPPGPGEVVLEVAAAGICGTDLHVDQWTAGYAFVAAAMPVTLGHEFAGRIASMGPGAGSFAIGDLVTALPSVTCQCCAACLSGNPAACTDRKGIGLSRNGAFTRLVSVPERNCPKLPVGVTADLGALTEPLTVSAQAVATGEVRAGMRVLVLGPGMIGQGIALLAREAGTGAVVVAGKSDGARFLILRDLGFDDLIDLDAENATLPGGFDVVFEATGAAASIEQGLQALRPGGVLVVVGIHSRPAAFDATRLVRGFLQIRGSYRAPREVWQHVLNRLAAAPATFARLITHRLPVARALDAFALAHGRQACKVLLLPE